MIENATSADLFLFHMLKGGVDKRTRDVMGESIARSVNQSLGFARGAPSPAETEIVQRLERTGFAPVAPMFSPAELDEIDAYFADKPIHFSDAAQDTQGSVPARLADRPQGLRFGNWPQEVISGCPAFCRAAHDPGLLRVAEAYLGAPPSITILTAWWSFPSTAALGGMQNFHHDRDDFRMLKVFTYLTDTTETTGPHQFVEETHSFDALVGLMRRKTWTSAQQQLEFLRWMEVHRKDDGDVARNFPKENIRTITGARGSTFFEDTRGLHRGLPPVSGPRLAFEICYALVPKYNGEYAPIPYPCDPGPLSPATAYANRLFYGEME